MPTFHLRNANGTRLMAIPYEPITILGETFALHKLHVPATAKKPAHLHATKWQVSDPITGCSVARHSHTKTATIKEATEKVTFHGADKLKQARDAWLKRYGDKRKEAAAATRALNKQLKATPAAQVAA